jgi:hypothetical protein
MILVRPQRFSVLTILLAAGVALRAAPLARSADPGKEKQAAYPASRPFALTVLGPDGKCVPKIEVEIRSTPRLATAQIREGEFARSDEYGV